MRISPINNINIYKKEIKTKNIGQNKNVSFKASYIEEFKNLYTCQPHNGDAVINQLRHLLNAVHNDKGIYIKNNFFRNLPYVYSNIRSITDILSKIYSNGGSIAEKNGTTIIYMTNERALNFRHPNESKIVTIGITDKKDPKLYLEQWSEYTYDYYEFYNNHMFYPICKYEHVSGNGLGAVSTTTKYNPDGSEKSIFDIFDRFFG